MPILENFRPEYIILGLAALVVAWFLLRFLLRLTARVFTCGCLLIALASAGLLLLRFVF